MAEWGRTHPHGGPEIQPYGKRALSFCTGDTFSTLVARLRDTLGGMDRGEPSTYQDLHPIYSCFAQICCLRGLSSYPFIRLPRTISTFLLCCFLTTPGLPGRSHPQNKTRKHWRSWGQREDLVVS